MFFSTTKKNAFCAANDKKKRENCCTPQSKRKVNCPHCHTKAQEVLEKTVKALVTTKTKEQISCFNGFYYCKTPSCKTVYFKESTILTQENMNITVGLKEGVAPATICYCFGWTKEKIRTEIKKNGKTIASEDIKTKMEDFGCSCEILNPSGSCCLSDVTKVIREIKETLNMTN